jgi:hypothetical protein
LTRIFPIDTTQQGSLHIKRERTEIQSGLREEQRESVVAGHCCVKLGRA